MFDIKSYLLIPILMAYLMNSFAQTDKLIVPSTLGAQKEGSMNPSQFKNKSKDKEPFVSISDLKDPQTNLKNLGLLSNTLGGASNPNGNANSSVNALPPSVVLPQSLLSNLANKPASGLFELVGLFIGADTVRAEVLIAGMSHFYQVGDHLNQNWVIDVIDPNGIQVSRCRVKSTQCETKKVLYLGGLEP
jgi:hypothetical protein